MRRILFVLFTVLGTACGSDPSAPGDASVSSDAALDTRAPEDTAAPVDADWGACPDNAATTEYAIQTCAQATTASARVSSARPTWLCDNGSEVLSVETCIANTARALARPGLDTTFVTGCALDRLPPPCWCHCGRDRWGNASGQCPEVRRYLAVQLSYVVSQAVRLGTCW